MSFDNDNGDSRASAAAPVSSVGAPSSLSAVGGGSHPAGNLSLSLQTFLCNGTLVRLATGSGASGTGNVTGGDLLTLGEVPDDCCLWNTTGCPNLTTNGTLEEGGNPFIPAWYVQLIYVVAFAAMVLVAAGGNIIVIWIVLAHKRMRTVTNYFLVNLAVADALITILNTLFNSFYMIRSDWYFGRTYCKFSQFIAPCTISASVFTFMAIAIDRYMAIIHPLRPRMSARTVLAMIAMIWVASMLVALPQLLYSITYTWHYADGSSRTVCYLEWPDGVNNEIDFWYNVFLMLVNYFVPLGILAGTYARVGIELWGSRAIGEYTSRQEETVRSKRKVVKMMMVVVAIFGVCWLPQHVFFVLTNRYEHINNSPHIQHIYLVIYWLAMSNSMYNPLIYCWMNARFRKGFKYVFRWMHCVHYHKGDHPNLQGVVSMRTSVSEGTRFERNGSMMTTMIESVDETSYAASNTAMMHRGFVPMKRGFTSSENSF